ncbi:(2Fe-2S)-binding protein [Bradyrhizobium sacchari]|uniref:Carbon-monoxide dehydrogenase small subunit n=1 Tax=Bradyrhizobium sacchari TaxID=1399419 RepID=A0A560JTM5_9BRAD|nr:(2Fe-2S)-binding protein [Bradyrhizobium sacchari]OPY97050.1 (2Fe-2S)-binding protein [Bradyrhizobium sacchari]TWB58796.1 carbon-monoxide dehydrogenase small subunit [Bradyrhizobium sacchari]TWB72844.1 carbon-monoxide dehydrogenase small subunit [Bradyrhizobium sacchari]
MSARKINLTVNGEAVEAEVEARLNLADFLRQAIGLTGTHVGCEHGVCGACTVIVDGRPARACLMLAVQADGAKVETVESLGTPESLSELQQAFRDRHALQCGFCTPGMLMTIEALLRVEGSPTREEIRDVLSGNLCRCTGYQAIVDAALDAAEARRGTR